MNSKEELSFGKVSYEKPTAVDVGAAAPVVGASCAPGDEFAFTGQCIPMGNAAVDNCEVTGNSAGGVCDTGYDPTTGCGGGLQGGPPP